MGVIKQGILGGFSGKVGSVVGTSWKGRAVMKAMPLSVANPRTTGQVNQRTAMTECVSFAKSLLGGTIALLDNPFAGNISGYNRFVKRNVHVYAPGFPQPDSNVTISEGPLGGMHQTGILIAKVGNDFISVILGSNPSPYNLATDKVVACTFIMGTREVLQAGVVVGKRDDGTFVVPLNRDLVLGEQTTTFYSCIREDKKYCSDSAFSQSLVDPA